LVATYNGAVTTLYVDGVAQGTTASVGGAGHNAPIFMGMIDHAGGESFRGFLTEIAYYNFALSAARVLAHFNAAPAPGVPVSGFVGSYSSSTGSGVLPSPQSDLIYAAVHKTFPTTV